MKTIQPTTTSGKVKESKNQNINKTVMVDRWFQIPKSWHSKIWGLNQDISIETSNGLEWWAGHNETGLRQEWSTPL